MPQELIYVILANVLVSSGSLIGVITLALSRNFLGKILMSLVSLSAGTMLAAAFLHLLPESVNTLGPILPFQLTLISFIGFFLLEHFLHWRHCHDCDHPSIHTVGIMNLVGDSIHNFLDGTLIAATFAVNPGLGAITTLSIALHELPQELGDFGVLLHSGFTKKRALFWNIMVSLTAILGGILGYFASHGISSFAKLLIPVAAGGFIYISATDLIPELKTDTSSKKTFAMIASFLLGIFLMAIVKD
ncbi:MAG: ZIP family metal transporter [bacterium]